MELKCDFCGELREQVGQLSCKHHICGACFCFLSARTEKCYLCLSNIAQLNRANMRVIFSRDDVDRSSNSETPGDQVQKKVEKVQERFLFCPNDGCDFIGTGLSSHMERCKFQLLSEPGPFDTEHPHLLAASCVENATNVSRELTIVGLYKQMEDMAHRLSTVSKQLGEYKQGLKNEDDKIPKTPIARASVIPGVSYFETAAAVIIALLVAHCYYASQAPTTPLRDNGVPPDSTVSVVFTQVDDVVTKAFFNKREMVLSEEKRLQQYKVKLGFGGSLSASRPEVNLWVCAEIFKNDDNYWPVGQTLRLSLEHSDPEKSRFYDFLSTHSGSWKQGVRTEKGQLLFRQLQVESTRLRKYLRFSCVLNYDEALESGYIKNDSITVRLSIRI